MDIGLLIQRVMEFSFKFVKDYGYDNFELFYNSYEDKLILRLYKAHSRSTPLTFIYQDDEWSYRSPRGSSMTQKIDFETFRIIMGGLVNCHE